MNGFPKNMVFALRHIAKWLLEHKASCAWVQARLVAYYAVDPALSDAEFNAIERHVLQCARCAEDLEALREDRDAVAQILWPDEALPYIDVDAMVERIVSGEVGIPTASVPQQAENPYFFPFQIAKPAAAFVAAAILLVAVPVLAYVGGGIYDAIFPPDDGREMAAPQQGPETPTLVMTNSSTSSDQTSTNAESGGDSPVCSTSNSAFDEPFFTKIDEDMALQVARAEVEALLPHTEEEYEAWARKEYPHILALYDILIGKGLTPERPKQPNIPANWATMTIEERFTALIPNDLPEDVREYLLDIAGRAAQNDQPLWDGIPVNIPEWGLCLYTNTTAEERPTHWRALLIYSGEIFEFDWPKSQSEVNCVPNLHAIQYGTGVSGFLWAFSDNDADSVTGMPSSDATSDEPYVKLGSLGTPAVVYSLPSQEIPEGYIDAFVEDAAFAKTSLVYFAASSAIVQTPPFTDIAQSASKLLEELFKSGIPECNVGTRLLSLSALLVSRGELLNLNWLDKCGRRT
jgi:hypothetical protein